MNMCFFLLILDNMVVFVALPAVHLPVEATQLITCTYVKAEVERITLLILKSQFLLFLSICGFGRNIWQVGSFLSLGELLLFCIKKFKWRRTEGFVHILDQLVLVLAVDQVLGKSVEYLFGLPVLR